jgi:hypothetical protein
MTPPVPPPPFFVIAADETHLAAWLAEHGLPRRAAVPLDDLTPLAGRDLACVVDLGGPITTYEQRAVVVAVAKMEHEGKVVKVAPDDTVRVAALAREWGIDTDR